MRIHTTAGLILAVLTLFFGALSPCAALPFETFAAAGGNDGSDCLTPATACRQISTALTKVDSGGTVHLLPGFYDGVIITRWVNITAEPGAIIENNVSDCGGFGGIIIHADNAAVVNIRGLTLDQSRIFFCSGRELRLEDCVVRQQGYPGPSLLFAPTVPARAESGATKLTIRNCSISGAFASSDGNGVLIKPANGVSVSTLIENTLISGGGYGLRVDGTGQTSGRIDVDVKNTVSSQHTSNGFVAISNGGQALVRLNIEHSTAFDNAAFGAVATGAQVGMIINDSTFVRNGTGVAQQNGAAVASYKNNSILLNLTANTAGTINAIPLQ